MKNVQKRFIAGLFICLSLCLVLVGCSSTDGGEDAAGEVQQSDREDNNANNSSQVEEKVRITTSIAELGRVPASEGTIEDNRWVDWINEHSPAEVDFVAIPNAEREARFNTLFASGNGPDLMFEFSSQYNYRWYQQNQLMPLDDLIAEHSTTYKEMMELYPALKDAGTFDDGKLYRLGKVNEMFPLRAIFIRKDWLDHLNLDIPETTEELYEVARAFAKDDPDGNGENDTYGLALSGQVRVIDEMFQNLGFVVRDDEVVYAWDSVAAALDFRKRLYDEGIVDRDYLNDTLGEKAQQDFVTGKLGIYLAQLGWTGFIRNEYTSLKENVPDAEVIPIPLPESPAGAFNPTLQNPIQMTAAVYSGAENPEAVIKHVDFLAEPLTGHTLRFGFEGVHHELDANGCPIIIDGEHSSEVGYMHYPATMLWSSSLVTEGKCGLLTMYNTDIPIEQEGLEMEKYAREIYMDPNRPYPEITHPEHMPQLPRELNLTISETNKTIADIWVRAIVGGPDYTVEQAISDSKQVWENGKGPEAEEWMKNWYNENKDTAFLAEDMYEIMEQQKELW